MRPRSWSVLGVAAAIALTAMVFLSPAEAIPGAINGCSVTGIGVQTFQNYSILTTPDIINGRKLCSQCGITVCSLNPRNPFHTDRGFPDDFGTRKVIDLMCHYRTRTRRAFDNNFQDDCCAASHGHISLKPCGIVPVARPAAQSAMFSNRADARGPPWYGNQGLHPINLALDRPARQFCTAPLLSEFPVHNLTLAHHLPSPFFQADWVNGAGIAPAATDFPSNTTQPLTERSHNEIET
jgi:hypothetical protein